jgi:hypothetical protein
MNMQDLRWGIEIELIKIKRDIAAKAVQSVVGGTIAHEGGSYDCYSVTDLRGRKWKVVRDSSLSVVPESLQSEVVSPILKFEDIPQLQEIIRALRKAKAKCHSRCCGIHIHVESAPFNAKKLANLAKMVYKNEELFIHALGINESRLANYTRRMDENFIQRIDRQRPQTMDELNRALYGHLNTRPSHYQRERYHILNLHNAFYANTIEWRAANSTLHAGKVKSYIYLVLALAAKALNSKAASSRKKEFNPASAKYDMRVILLALGFIGDSFKTARKHLLANMPGDSAWKNGRPARQASA